MLDMEIKLKDLPEASILRLKESVTNWYNSLPLEDKGKIKEVDNLLKACTDSIDFIRCSRNVETQKNRYYIGYNGEWSVVVFKIKDVFLGKSINDKNGKIAYCCVDAFFVKRKAGDFSMHVRTKNNYSRDDMSSPIDGVIIYINKENKVCTEILYGSTSRFYVANEITEHEYNELIGLDIKHLEYQIMSNTKMKDFLKIEN